jgi:RHS repeat-associated protein
MYASSLRRNIYALFLGAGLAGSAFAAPPIEALQRSVQQRWPLVNAGQHCVFPRASSDNSPNPVPLYPQNGYYGADLDNPATLNTLVLDLENKVFNNLTSQYFLIDSLEGTLLGVSYDYRAHLDPANYLASYKVSAVVPGALPAATSPIDARIARIEEALTLCKNVPRDLTADGYNKHISYFSGFIYPPNDYAGTCDRGVPAATAIWNSQGWTYQGDRNHGNWAQQAIESSNSYVGSNANYPPGQSPLASGVVYDSWPGQLKFNAYDSSGSVDFFVVASPDQPTLPSVPVAPDGLWHGLSTQSGTGVISSKWMGPDPTSNGPPPPLPDGPCPKYGSWTVTICAGIFHGNFDDEWNGSDCGSCKSGMCATAKEGPVDVSVDLFSSNFGDDGNSLLLRADRPSSSLATPAGLGARLGTTSQMIKHPTTGAIRQVLTPTTFADILTTSASAYTVNIYPAQGIGDPVGGLYQPIGTPARVVTVQNPSGNANQLQITETIGSANFTTLYTYVPATDECRFTQDGGTTIRSVARTKTATGREEIWTHLIAPNTVTYKEKRVYYFAPWGRYELVSRIVDPDGAALTTSWTFSTVAGGNYGKLISRMDPNGYWENYTYGTDKRETKRVCQVGNTAPGSADASNRVITTNYTTNGSNPAVTEVETTLGLETARRYKAYFPNETRDIVCTVAGAAWNAASNLVTATKSTTGGPFNGQIKSLLKPDGTFTTYTYQTSAGSNGEALKTTSVAYGQPDSLGAPTVVISGTLTTTTVDSAGNPRLQTVQAITSAQGALLNMTSATTQQADGFGRPTLVALEDGSTEVTTYGCCGLESKTDRNAVTTSYTYDSARRLATESRAGVTMSYSYDPGGRRTLIQRIGSDASIIAVATNTYDLAGRLMSTMDGAGRVTRFAETFAGGQLVRTITFAFGTGDAAARVETYNQDGTLLSVGGAAAHPLAYDYGVDAAGKWRRETRVGDGGATSEWVKTYTNLAGRDYRTLTSTGAETLRTFNGSGLDQLVSVRDPDLATTLYAYNGRGENRDTAISSNGGATIAYSGNDQITRVDRDFVTRSGGPVVVRETTSVWDQFNNGAAKVLRVVDRTPNGRQTWVTDFPQSGQSLTTTVSEFVSGGVLTRTTTFPDGTSTAEQSIAGRIVSQTRFDSASAVIGSRSFSYDPHGRLAAVSPSRIGATTFTYTGADETQTVTEAAETTAYTYDFRGRKTKDTLPDLAEVNYTYFPSGELASMGGARTYPQVFTYDAQGRMKTLVTSGSAGNATTTWNYDSQTGFLVSKIYQDGKGTSYTSTAAGRPQTRTWARGVVTSYTPDFAGRIQTISYTGGIPTPTVNIAYDRRGRAVGFDRGAAGVQNIALGDDGFWLGELFTGGPLDGVAVQVAPNTLRQRIGLAASVSGSPFVAQSFDYDSAGHLSHAGYGGTIQATYGYVPNSFVDLVGAIDFAAGGSTAMTTTKSYDSNRDRLTGVASNIGATPAAGFGYHYNLAGQRDKATLADGGRWDYGYDSLGQVTGGSRKFSDGTAVQGQQFGYSFDSIGNRTQTNTNGRIAPYTNNLLNQIVTRTVPQVVDVSGRASPQATVTVNDQPTIRQDNGYFSAAVTVPDRGADATPVTVNINAVIPGPSPGGNNIVASQVGEVSLARHPETFAYDLDGNLLSDGIWNYAWDAENRLVQMTSYLPVGNPIPKTQLDFQHDAFGRRISKVTTPRGGTVVTAKFVYDGWNLIAELDGSNALVRSYLWGTDLSGSPQGAGGVGGLLAVHNVSPTVTDNFVANDGNGNVAALVDANTRTISASYEYGPFGELIRASGTAAAANPMRWSSKFQDSESGFSYYGNRYYNPGVGRWLNRDFIAEEGGLNLYGLVANSAVNWVDADGLEIVPITFQKDVEIRYFWGGNDAKGIAGQETDYYTTVPVRISAEFTTSDCGLTYRQNYSGGYRPDDPERKRTMEPDNGVFVNVPRSTVKLSLSQAVKFFKYVAPEYSGPAEAVTKYIDAQGTITNAGAFVATSYPTVSNGKCKEGKKCFDVSIKYTAIANFTYEGSVLGSSWIDRLFGFRIHRQNSYKGSKSGTITVPYCVECCECQSVH